MLLSIEPTGVFKAFLRGLVRGSAKILFFRLRGEKTSKKTPLFYPQKRTFFHPRF
jgi:hypothetical protein